MVVNYCNRFFALICIGRKHESLSEWDPDYPYFGSSAERTAFYSAKLFGLMTRKASLPQQLEVLYERCVAPWSFSKCSTVSSAKKSGIYRQCANVWQETNRGGLRRWRSASFRFQVLSLFVLAMPCVMIKIFSLTKVAYFPTKYRFPYLCRFP